MKETPDAKAAAQGAIWTVLPVGIVEAAKDGWFTVTTASERNCNGSIELFRAFDAIGKNVYLEFDYISWGGNSQGCSFYLLDADVAGAGMKGTGNFGRGFVNLVGGYIGIGLDPASYLRPGRGVKGPQRDAVLLFSSSRERGRNAILRWIPPTRHWSYDGSSCATRQQAIDAGGLRHVVAKFSPKKYRPGYTIDVSVDGTPMLKDHDYPYPAPSSMKVGISATNYEDTGTQEFKDIKFYLTDPDETGCPVNGNLVRNVPAYVSTTAGQVYAYPQLNDGDHVHRGWDGAGKWGNQLTGPLLYGLDLSGTNCQDSDGLCAALPGKGAVEMNTVVVYSRQDDGAQQEPSDSTVFTQHGAIDFRVEAQEENSTDWVELALVQGNNLVKRTVRFSTGRYWRLQVLVERAASDGPALVGVEAYES